VSFLVENSLNNSKKTFSEYHSGDPFSSYGFLNALQETNCLDSDSGWIAKCLNHTNGTAIPFFEKLNNKIEEIIIKTIKTPTNLVLCTITSKVSL